jgi:hypothetical protein
VNTVRAAVSRRFLKPSLRMMRDSFGAHPDYRAIRAMSARFDAMLAEDPGELRTEIVALPECSATWMTVKGAPRPRDPVPARRRLHRGDAGVAYRCSRAYAADARAG